MPQIQTFLDQLAGSGQLLPMVVMALIFASVALGVLATAGMATSRGVLRRRLQSEGQTVTARAELSLRVGDGRSWLERLLKPLAHHLTPSEDVRLGSIRMRLVQAGFMRPSAVGTYHALRLISGVVLPLVILALMPLLSKTMTVNQLLVLGASAILVGLYLPPAMLSKRIERRQLEIYEGFPDALDMMLVCVEAGLGLDAAINRVGAEIGKAHSVLGEQMELVGLEMRAGKPRHEALRNLADRSGVDDLNSLVTMLIQTDKFGTSVAQSLRVYSETLRTKRRQRAEEAAAKTGVKMVFPLVFCIFPAIWVVTIGPAAIRFVQVLFPMVQNAK